MDVTEEDFLSAITSEEAFYRAVTAKPQGWYSLFFREKDRLLHRIRQNQSLRTAARSHRSSDQEVVALAAEHARLEQINDLIDQAAALRDSAPKIQHVIGTNKAQRVLGGEAPRPPRPRHRKSISWDGQPKAYQVAEEDSEDDSEKERDRLANDLAEGRRMIEENLRRLVTDESTPSPPRPRSRTVDSSPKTVRFDVADSMEDSLTGDPSRSSGISHSSGASFSSGTSASSGSSYVSRGSQASGTSYGSVSSYASDREHSRKAMKMLGIGPKRSP